MFVFSSLSKAVNVWDECSPELLGGYQKVLKMSSQSNAECFTLYLTSSFSIYVVEICPPIPGTEEEKLVQSVGPRLCYSVTWTQQKHVLKFI
jgi:hypothetical protein